jgi:hypothetical protein
LCIADSQLSAEKERADDLQRLLAIQTSNPNTANGRTVSGSSIELTPGISRGSAGTQVLLIPESAVFIEIDLKVLSEGHKAFRAELYDSNEREIAMQDLLKAVKGDNDTFVPFRYFAEHLSSGEYKIQLKSIDGRPEPIVLGNYYFLIRRHD